MFSRKAKLKRATSKKSNKLKASQITQKKVAMWEEEENQQQHIKQQGELIRNAYKGNKAPNKKNWTKGRWWKFTL